MKNMKVAKKLIVSFLIVIFLAVVVGVFGILGMDSINSADDDMYNYNLMAISAMGEIRENMQRTRVGLRNFVLYAGDPEGLKTQRDTMSTVETRMTELFALYEATITDNSLESSYFTAKKLYQEEYIPLIDQVYDAAQRSFDEASALILSDTVAKNTNDMIDAFTVSMNNNEVWGKESVDANTTLFTQMTIVEIVLLVIAAAVAMILAIYISRLISRPLGLLSAFMQRAGTTGDIELRPEDIENINKCAQFKDETGVCIASTTKFVNHVAAISKELSAVAGGDLTTKIEVLSDRDVMGMSMKTMVDNLNNMFAEINSSSAQVSTGSKQIADGSQTLAQGSTEQAAAVQELSSAISEIADKTKANAQMAGKAANLANTIMVSAKKGSAQMDEMMSAVKEINQASQSINRVIKVIDDIAFQTNILALNAAVEAARAGQHGKGFAVVAEEVRNLAAKSAEAAKDTSGLIANSMEKAELGARIADETAASLVEIVSGINDSNQLVGDIAKSSEEQSEGIMQINRGIDQVAQVIQQNSATAEESAAASQEMSGQSMMLEELISRFKLKDSSLGGPRQKQLEWHDDDAYSASGEYGKY